MSSCVLVDKDIPFLDDFIPDKIKLIRFDPLKKWESIPSEVRNSCNALIVRTVSRIDAQNFNVSHFPVLKFIGTASAGHDHIDVKYLQSNGIWFADSGGANAQAVGEYVASVIVQWTLDTGKSFEDCTVGVVGYGHTGSKAGSILSQLGCKIIPHDPPKAEKDSAFKSSTVKEVLNCDVITFHVPYTNSTEYPTRYWLDEARFANFKGELIINAARGGVVNETALVNWYKQSPESRRFVLDVWENEPHLDEYVPKLAWISTPHIAGYSIQSKRNATRMILKSMCTFLSIPNTISDSCTNLMNIDSYQGWHPLFELSDKLKQGLLNNRELNASLFRNLRQHSKLRNEFKFTTSGKFTKLSDNPKVQRLIKVCGGPL